jgi:hypothetical protein
MLSVLNQRHTKCDRSVLRIDGHRAVSHQVGARLVRASRQNSYSLKRVALPFHTNSSMLFPQITVNRYLYAKRRTTLLFGLVVFQTSGRSRPFEPFVGFRNRIFRTPRTGPLRAESIRQAETNNRNQNSQRATRRNPVASPVNVFTYSPAYPRAYVSARSIYIDRHAFLLVMLHKTNRNVVFLQATAMFFQNDFQAGLGTKQRHSNVIHRYSQRFGDLSIALFQVVTPVNQIPVALGQLLHRGLQHSNSGPVAARLR